MAAYGFRAPSKKRGTTSTGGRTTSVPQYMERAAATGQRYRPTPQYKERESRNKADDVLRAQVLAALGQAVRPPGQGPGAGAFGPGGTTAPLNMPQVPVEPVAGNPYKGVEAAIGRFVQASSRRQKGDVAAARKSLKGVHDPGADITGSFNTQAAGMAAELAATGTSLRNQARAGFAEEELKRRSQSAQNRYDARSMQIKNDAQLMEQGAQAGLTASQAQALASEGLDPMQYIGNPMRAAIDIGRARFARRGEYGLPPTAWAQAAQYGLQPPTAYGSREAFYTALGQAKAGTYGGGTDALELIAALQSSGLLEGMGGG
jgi:hypothetical protein